MSRPVYEIAHEIVRDWKKPYYGAVPYLQAMRQIDSIYDNYGAESGETVVRYFLGNAHTWRGPVAKRIKAELNAMINPKLTMQKGNFYVYYDR